MEARPVGDRDQVPPEEIHGSDEDFREDEDQFRLLVESVQDYAIFLLSPTGRILSWNAGAERLKGYRAEEIVGHSFTRFYPLEDVQLGVPQALLARCAAEGRVVTEGWRVRKDGTRFWAEVVLTALRDRHGRLRGFAKVTRDLTERIQAEEARAKASHEEGARIASEAAQAELRTSRDQLAAILAGVAEGITVQDGMGRLVYANDAAARLCGFADVFAFLAAPVTEIMSRFAIFDEAGAPFPVENLPGRRVFRGEAPVEVLVQFRFPASGEVRWSLVNATPIRDESGQVRLAVNIFRDLTERRHDEEMSRFLAAASMELTRSLDYEQTLQEVARRAVPTLADWCAVDVLDDDGQIKRLAVTHVDPNKTRYAMELARRYPADIRSTGGVARVMRTGHSVLAPDITDAGIAASARDVEHLAILRSLGMRSALIVPMVARGVILGAITLVQAESGRRYGPRELAIAEDLAARAALAIDNARLYREAQENAARQVDLNATLSETMDRLKEILWTRDEFLSSVSHDLKNPIASIKGTAQLLLRRLKRSETVDPQQLEGGLIRIDLVAKRLTSLVDELLDVARMHMGGSLDFERTSTDLVNLTREIVAEYQDASPNHAIRLETDTPEIIGWWDQNRLSRVIGNLIDNARKYSPEGGEIRVSIKRESASSDEVVLTVEDDGLGIPPEDVERIFDRFQRGSNVAGTIPGTGIGLTSARHIVEGHGGSIAASSVPGKGSVFTIRLPLGNADPSEAPADENVPRGRKSG